MFISHLSGSRYRDLRMRIQVSRDRNSAYGLLSNLAGSLRERRVSLKHMAYHSHGNLMLAQKHLAGDVSLKGGQFFIAVRTPTVSMCGFTVRASSTMRRTSTVSGRRPRACARGGYAPELGLTARRHCRNAESLSRSLLDDFTVVLHDDN